MTPGPSDLDKAVRDDGGPDAGEELTTDRFLVGYQRLFTTPAKDRFVIIFVYQFADATGANTYIQSAVKRELAPQDGADGHSVLCAGHRRRNGRRRQVQRHPFHEVAFVKGSHGVMVVTNDEHGDTAKPNAVELAAQQYARL